MTILEILLANEGSWELLLKKLGIDPNAEWVEPRQWNAGERLPLGYYICPGINDAGFFVWQVTEDSQADGDEYGPYLVESAAAQAMTRGDHLAKPATPKDLRPLLDEARAMIERLSAAVREAQP